MARARTSIFCERCGAVAPVEQDSAEARYCASCKSFICLGCWDGESFRCATCSSQASAASPRGRANLDWASIAFRDLASVRPELETLDADVKHGFPDTRQLQRRLLQIKAED